LCLEVPHPLPNWNWLQEVGVIFDWLRMVRTVNWLQEVGVMFEWLHVVRTVNIKTLLYMLQ